MGWMQSLKTTIGLRQFMKMHTASGRAVRPPSEAREMTAKELIKMLEALGEPLEDFEVIDSRGRPVTSVRLKLVAGTAAGVIEIGNK